MKERKGNERTYVTREGDERVGKKGRRHKRREEGRRGD